MDLTTLVRALAGVIIMLLVVIVVLLLELYSEIGRELPIRHSRRPRSHSG